MGIAALASMFLVLIIVLPILKLVLILLASVNVIDAVHTIAKSGDKND